MRPFPTFREPFRISENGHRVLMTTLQEKMEDKNLYYSNEAKCINCGYRFRFTKTTSCKRALGFFLSNECGEIEPLVINFEQPKRWYANDSDYPDSPD